MSFIRKLKGVCAIVAILTFILMSIIVICGIWIEGMGDLYWKLLGTSIVVLALAGFLHAVLNGMDNSDRKA